MNHTYDRVKKQAGPDRYFGAVNFVPDDGSPSQYIKLTAKSYPCASSGSKARAKKKARVLIAHYQRSYEEQNMVRLEIADWMYSHFWDAPALHSWKAATDRNTQSHGIEANILHSRTTSTGAKARELSARRNSAWRVSSDRSETTPSFRQLSRPPPQPKTSLRDTGRPAAALPSSGAGDGRRDLRLPAHAPALPCSPRPVVRAGRKRPAFSSRPSDWV